MAVAAAVTIVAAVASAYAQYQAGQAQGQVYDYQKKVAANQKIAAEQAAAIAAENARVRHENILATQRARLGAAGVTQSEGSPLIVQMESAEQAALDEARIRYAGRVQATGYQSQQILAGYQARAARVAGTTAAGVTLLGGAAKAYGGYKPSPDSGVDTSGGGGYT